MSKRKETDSKHVGQSIANAPVMRSLRVWWRKHGAKVLLLFILLSIFISNVAIGFFEIMMLTVPCGIRKVNTCYWLWYPRQLYFFLIGLFTMLH